MAHTHKVIIHFIERVRKLHPWALIVKLIFFNHHLMSNSQKVLHKIIFPSLDFLFEHLADAARVSSSMED